MNLAELSIKRPTFISCLVIVMLAVGYLSMQKLGVDLFPDVTFPVVYVNTPYPGAGPSEIETLVSKPIEDEVSTISGLKRLRSVNQEGVSVVIAEFTLETDVKYAEQQVRDRVSSVRRNLPTDIKEPIIRRVDPSDQPIVILSVRGNLPDAALYDLANENIRPKIEQVNQVGLVEVYGGRKREIHVALDLAKLKSHEISASQVATRLASAGENIPAGKVNAGRQETVFRTLGEFKSIGDVKATIVNFFGSDVPTTVADVGEVKDTLEDEKTRTFVNGEKSLLIYVYRQSGANTIAVADGVLGKMGKINDELKQMKVDAKIEVVRDASKWIRANILDVQESIFFGVFLAVMVVFLFLGSGRSTIITGLALPNSLIGAFILMALAGFTVNVMTLLALSLSVGLLIDDAIVVRENIFRHIELGADPKKASIVGTNEVMLAVVATTLTVIAVFGPVAFLKGVVGQFFKQFGATICFAMAISLFDALTVAPMLSTYFAGPPHRKGQLGNSFYDRTVGRVLLAFNKFQERLENLYERILNRALRTPIRSILISAGVFLICVLAVMKVPKTFLPTQDAGEFRIGLDLPPGANLESMTDVSLKIDSIVRKHPEVQVSSLTIGDREGQANVASFFIQLVPAKKRSVNTSVFKDIIRKELVPFAYANPAVQDYDAVGGGMRPFNVNIISSNQEELQKISQKAFEQLKKDPRLKDVDINFRPGKPETQIVPDLARMKRLGISTTMIGNELRSEIEGVVPAKYRENGVEYDVRVRLKEEQRNLREQYSRIYVPNINNNLIRLADVAKAVDTVGPAKIYRQDRGRYIQISADIAPGAGMGNVMDDIRKMFDTDIKLPAGMRFMFVGQAENFQELGESMMIAVVLAILFIYLVLASLYESFVTPLSIMLALPLAVCGSFVALFITQESLNIFSMIGIIMLLGVATKNSILLVDYANQLIREGKERTEALVIAGKTRLRPILMTTLALIFGTLPIALGLNEASRQRTSMGIAIIGGLISSTLLTLIVVPTSFSYLDRFRIWSKNTLYRWVSGKGSQPPKAPGTHTASAATPPPMH